MPKRSKFNLSHTMLTTMSMGDFTPVSIMEVLPGDVWRQNVKGLLRVSPLNAPVMHPCHVLTQHWFVPFRS